MEKEKAEIASLVEKYGRIQSLIEYVNRDTLKESYRKQPKGNGKMWGLGIPSFEDKVVQGVFKEILEAIYEPKFKEFSFGFRPGRSCHEAIQRVNKHIRS